MHLLWHAGVHVMVLGFDCQPVHYHVMTVSPISVICYQLKAVDVV